MVTAAQCPGGACWSWHLVYLVRCIRGWGGFPAVSHLYWWHLHIQICMTNGFRRVLDFFLLNFISVFNPSFSVLPAMKRFFLGLVCLTVFTVGGPYFPDSYFLTEEYEVSGAAV